MIVGGISQDRALHHAVSLNTRRGGEQWGEGGKRGCFKRVCPGRREGKRCAILSRNPPPHVGGYGAWAISKHALSRIYAVANHGWETKKPGLDAARSEE